ncbi:MAG: hypothetical protein M1835_000100 [Candelina submexicana]|nr:MAG: hypothetical protein M1835_000100 [Candelina submexicana]
MPPASNEEQFKFLISCIRYSNNGKVDFGEVARECGIVTKGAAAKRYERMMKAHGILPGGPPVSATSVSSTPKSSTKSTPSKKRKTKDFDDSFNEAVDDDEGLLPVKDEVKPLIIKDEEPTYGQVRDGMEGLQASVVGSISTNDSNLATGTAFNSDENAAIRELFKVEECASGSAQSLSEGLYDNPMLENAAPMKNSGMALQDSILIAD